MNATLFDRAISVTLRSGVLLSTALIATGTVVTFVHRAQSFDRRLPVATLEQIGHGLDTAPAIIANLAQGRGQAIVIVGILLLLVTPVARVALSIGLFAREQDWKYVAITAAVLALLVVATWSGGRG